MVDVGRPDQGHRLPGVGEDRAAVLRVGVADGLRHRQAPGGEEQVAAAQRAEAGRAPDRCAQPIRPGAGGVDDGRRVDLRAAPAAAGGAVGHADAEHGARPVEEQLLDLRVRQDHRAGGGGVEGHAQDEAGVVGPGVAVAERRREVRVPDARRQQLQLPAVEPPVGPSPGQQVVGGEAALHHGRPRRAAACDRHEEPELLDQARRGAQERLAPADALPDDADLQVGEVAEAAVDELARPGAGARGEVALLDAARYAARPARPGGRCRSR